MFLPVSSVNLSHDVCNAVVADLIVEVAGVPVSPVGVNVQVERVETPTVGHHTVKQTEPLTLLQTRF